MTASIAKTLIVVCFCLIVVPSFGLRVHKHLDAAANTTNTTDPAETAQKKLKTVDENCTATIAQCDASTECKPAHNSFVACLAGAIATKEDVCDAAAMTDCQTKSIPKTNATLDLYNNITNCIITQLTSQLLTVGILGVSLFAMILV